MNALIRTALVLIFLLAAAGCSRDVSLQGAFEKQMRTDRMDGFNIIHLEENESDGLVLYTAWTKEYPDNKDRPGINYYEKGAAGWVNKTGTACPDSGVARLGLMGNGYLFCAILKEYMEFEKILVGATEARVFQATDKIRVWYAIESDEDSKVKGITSDGQEVPLD